MAIGWSKDDEIRQCMLNNEQLPDAWPERDEDDEDDSLMDSDIHDMRWGDGESE